MALLAVLLLTVGAVVAAYGVYPFLCRRSATEEEAACGLAGDDLVHHPKGGYTLATTIDARTSDVWPWLVQLGQGRGGFYTHAWIENLLRTDIHNAGRIVGDYQRLSPGDLVRLTPDLYLGKPGQSLVVSRVSPRESLVLGQRLPNGKLASWTFVLRRRLGGTTRLLFRRRTEGLTWFDRLLLPGYLFMDRGMLAGLKRRAERAAPRVIPIRREPAMRTY